MDKPATPPPGETHLEDAARDYITGRVKDGASRKSIEQELIQRGYDPALAKDTVGRVMRKQRSPRLSGMIYLLVGILITIGTVAMTIEGYNRASAQGGTYYIWCGMFLFGVYLTIRGIRQLATGRVVKF